MRLKLDENLGRSAARVLVEAGHDVATVVGQGLAGGRDEELFRLCADEHRALVTLDLDFSNPLRFDPSAASGIVVLRMPEPPKDACGLSSLNGSASTSQASRIARVRNPRDRRLPHGRYSEHNRSWASSSPHPSCATRRYRCARMTRP